MKVYGQHRHFCLCYQLTHYRVPLAVGNFLRFKTECRYLTRWKNRYRCTLLKFTEGYFEPADAGIIFYLFKWVYRNNIISQVRYPLKQEVTHKHSIGPAGNQQVKQGQ